MRRRFLLVLLVAGCLCFPAKRTEAIDPVTIAILAPIALKVAQKASPYIIRSLRSGGAHMVTTGKHMLDIFLLPLGCLEATVGAPLGMFTRGVRHMVYGVAAPLLVTWDILCLPLAFCGLSP